MTDERAEMQQARAHGLRVRNETREARAIRRAVAEEIAVAIEGQVGNGEWAGDYYRKAAQIAREIGSRQIGAEETS
jgi:hypothetical protein